MKKKFIVFVLLFVSIISFSFIKINKASAAKFYSNVQTSSYIPFRFVESEFLVENLKVSYTYNESTKMYSITNVSFVFTESYDDEDYTYMFDDVGITFYDIKDSFYYFGFFVVPIHDESYGYQWEFSLSLVDYNCEVSSSVTTLFVTYLDTSYFENHSNAFNYFVEYPVSDRFNYSFKIENLSSDYFNGYNSGLQSGQSESYNSGFNAGYDDGYGDGVIVGESSGYDKGYDDGYVKGESSGYDNAYDNGYNVGYNAGYYVGIDENVDSNFLGNAFLRIADVPFQVLSDFLNFEVFGFNYFSLLCSFLTLGIALLLLRKFL